jgi:hypothetical protein
MARAQHVPDGPWVKTTDKVHWLNYATVVQQSDFTGNEYIQLQNDIRAKVAEASSILKEHNIEIFNVYTMQALDTNMYDTVYRIAIGFAHKEDLVLAKMIIKCNV